MSPNRLPPSVCPTDDLLCLIHGEVAAHALCLAPFKAVLGGDAAELCVRDGLAQRISEVSSVQGGAEVEFPRPLNGCVQVGSGERRSHDRHEDEEEEEPVESRHFFAGWPDKMAWVLILRPPDYGRRFLCSSSPVFPTPVSKSH